MKKRKKISFKKILSRKAPKKKEVRPTEPKPPEKETVTHTEPVAKKEKIEKKEVREEKKAAKKVIEKQEQRKAPSKSEEIMIVRVKNEFYGIPLASVEEIKREIKLTRTPQLSEFLSGIAEIRDLIIPVVNLSQLFGIEKEISSAKKTPVIVLEISEQLVGLQVSEIVEIIEVHKKEILPLPDIFPPQLFSGGYTYNSIIVGVLNVESLLKGKQIQSFKEKIDEVIK